MTDKSLKSGKTPLEGAEDAALAAFFEAGKSNAPVPNAALMGRVMADAMDDSRARYSASGVWSRLLGAIGGWPAAAGLATATVAGLWIGFAQPDAVGDLAYDIGGTSAADFDLAELLPGFDLLDGEG